MTDPRIPVLITDEYIIRLELVHGLLFAHCEVKKWGAEIKRKLIKDWESIVKYYQVPMHCMQNPETEIPKSKFLEMFGFRHCADINTKIGPRRIFVCEVKNG